MFPQYVCLEVAICHDNLITKNSFYAINYYPIYVFFFIIKFPLYDISNELEAKTNQLK